MSIYQMEELIKRLEIIEAQNKEILELLQKKKQPTKEPIKTLEERKKEFKLECWNAFKDKITLQTIKEFFEYWSESNLEGKKMRFEKESVFDLNRRMNTWLKNNNKIQPTNGANGLNIGN